MSDNVRPYSDIVTALHELREGRDKNAWEMGDLAEEFTVHYAGRPPADEEARTLAQLARDSGIEYVKLSSLRSNSAFYPTEKRFGYPNLSWSHYDLARRKSADVDDAMALLAEVDKQHWPVEDMRPFADLWSFYGKQRREEYPDLWPAFFMAAFPMAYGDPDNAMELIDKASQDHMDIHIFEAYLTAIGKKRKKREGGEVAAAMNEQDDFDILDYWASRDLPYVAREMKNKSFAFVVQEACAEFKKNYPNIGDDETMEIIIRVKGREL